VEIEIDGNILEHVKVTKFLGIYIDEDLNWKRHTSYISLKISKSLGVINRVKFILSSNFLLSLYHTLIHPYLLYCNILLGGASQIALYRLVCLEKSAMRLIKHSNYRSASTLLFLRLRILPLNDIHRYQIGLYMYRAANNMLPLSCSYHVSILIISHRFVFRDIHTFEILPFRTNFRKYVRVVGPEIWHALPIFVKSSVTESIFKKRLTNCMLEEYI